MTRRLSIVIAAAVILVLPQATVSAVVITPGIFHRPLVGHRLRNDTVASANWSGYAAEATSEFRAASGSWVQPAASCTARGSSYASFWVGLDGYATNSVEQLGTDSDCGRGRPVYYAWWELYPAGSVNLPSTAYPVAPGDVLTATVSHSGTSYTLSLTSSRGWAYSTNQSASDANGSAEWIAESPEVCSVFSCSSTRLTNFGSMSFASSQAAVAGGPAQPISSFTANGGPHQITMVSTAGTPRAVPSALTPDGAGFSDTWVHA